MAFDHDGSAYTAGQVALRHARTCIDAAKQFQMDRALMEAEHALKWRNEQKRLISWNKLNADFNQLMVDE